MQGFAEAGNDPPPRYLVIFFSLIMLKKIQSFSIQMLIILFCLLESYRLCFGKPPSINTLPNAASVHGIVEVLHYRLLRYFMRSCLRSFTLQFADLKHFDFEKDREESPRGVLDGAEASSKVNSCSDSRSNTSMWHGLFQLWRHKSTRRLASFPPTGFPKLSKKKNSRKAHEDSCEDAGNQFCFFKPSWKNFTISELQRATNNFNSGLLRSLA